MAPTTKSISNPRQCVDEYAFRPARIRVKAGTSVTRADQGTGPHDGTRRIVEQRQDRPGRSGAVRFTKPGIHLYVRRDHLMLWPADRRVEIDAPSRDAPSS